MSGAFGSNLGEVSESVRISKKSETITMTGGRIPSVVLMSWRVGRCVECQRSTITSCDDDFHSFYEKGKALSKERVILKN